MFKKIWIIAGIVVCVVAVMLLVTMLMPFFQSMSNVIANDTTVGNYWGYKAAGQAMPLWIYAIPLLVGFVAVVMILRKKTEKN